MKDSKDNSGQAIFEFLVFVPLLLGLYGIIVNITGSINASINQQKSAEKRKGWVSPIFPASIAGHTLLRLGHPLNFTRYSQAPSFHRCAPRPRRPVQPQKIAQRPPYFD